MARETAPTATWGAGIAGKVSEHLTRSVLSARERSAGLTGRIAMDVQEQFFRLTGAEVRRTVGPLWAKIADHEQSPAWLKATTEFVGRGQGQWQTMLASTATGAAMGGGILGLITNEMQPTIGALIRENPNAPLSPSDAAHAQAANLSWGIDLWTDAAQAGVNRDRFNVMVELSRPQAPVGDVLTLWRRGLLNDVFTDTLLQRQGYHSETIGLLKRASEQIPTLPDAAAMWARSAITDERLAQIGHMNGFTDTDIHAYSETAGQPPSPELLYTAYRRGIIDADRLRRGIIQGPIRNEWFDVIEKMQYHSMTPEQAADAVNQGHMQPSRGQAIAKEYGLNPDDFSTIIDTAGAPPGIEFATQAYNRGFIGASEYDQMFLESRIKNRYLPLLQKMRTQILPRETALSMLAKGAITKEYCAQVLHWHGYNDTDVDAQVNAALVDKTSAHRDLSLSQIGQLYQDREIDSVIASEWIKALGYDDSETAWILTIYDLRRVTTFRNAIVSRVRSAYVRGMFSADDASLTLDKLRVPADRKSDLIALWDIERQTITRDLTPAQIVSAVKKGALSIDQGMARLIGQGYADPDALIMLQIGGAAPITA